MYKKVSIVIILLLVIVSCTKEEIVPKPEVPSSRYLPIASGNHWNYIVRINGYESRDSLFVLNNEVIDNINYSTFANHGRKGLFVQLMSWPQIIQNFSGTLVYKTDSTLHLRENFMLQIQMSGIEIIGENAPADTIFGTSSTTYDGTITNRSEYGNRYTIHTTTTNTAVRNHEIFISPNGKIYYDVLEVLLNVNASMTTNRFEDTIETVLPAQDILMSSQFYAKDIGMVYSKSKTAYQLTRAIDDGPVSGQKTVEEFLDN